MNKHLSTQPLTAEQHAQAMQAYIDDGVRRAMALGNRGPIRLDGDGKLADDILNDYREHGFYVFTNVVSAEELAELRSDVERVLAVAPEGPDDPDRGREAHGDPAHGLCFQRPSYRFARPLSDPLGGTSENKGRHPVKMEGPLPAEEAPEWTVERLIGNLQLMDSCLRLYGHHGLLSVAEAVLGPDFVPYNEVTFVKEPGLGPSVAWHQDGTTHWDAPDWDQDAHGYNSMTQLYPSTPGNGVWVLPGSHKLGKADIKRLVAESGSERIDGAVPMICDAGDVFITNRQLVHGSFANSSGDRRVTLNAGFFPRKRVLNVTTSHLNGNVETFDTARIHERCRVIAVAVDARQQRYPDEPRYRYQPLAAEQDANHWNEETRQSVIRDYNVRDFYI